MTATHDRDYARRAFEQGRAAMHGNVATGMNEKDIRTDDEWRELLTPEQFRVLAARNVQ